MQGGGKVLIPAASDLGDCACAASTERESVGEAQETEQEHQNYGCQKAQAKTIDL